MARGWRAVAACGLGLACLIIAGCASNEEAAYVERPVEDLYNEAMDYLEGRSYTLAAASFDEVERQHPYSKWATKAQIMAAYTHYAGGNYDEAVLTLDRFIELHPGSEDVAYAYYLKGLSYYEQISDVARDQRMTERALGAFTDLVRRFPDSKYARDALLKIDLAHDHLAGKEMNVGRYYLRTGHELAAIGRFRRVVETYGTTTHVAEALHRLTEAYLALGIVDEARFTAAVLRHNYPDSEWYKDSWTLLARQNVLTAQERGLPQTAGVVNETSGETN
ncbi:MAG: outer membrane protein assembly factor BamD [Rhodospirillales bacterium]|nr:MAG: outer membrane protein assembly factor BamD [Rhodospirillales bacterium]